MISVIDKEFYRKKIDELRCCVIIPTYNNSKTVARVIADIAEFTSSIIVVNDGSTDATTEILKSVDGIISLSYFPNKGKGMALRTGLKEATSRGFRYAITIDSDGQHYADDLTVFIDKIENTPDSLLVGSRNLNQENMPKKNTFGNKFSNFWFKFETGISLPDTQSGFRLYPLNKISGTHYFTSKYEFEIEVLVKAAWKNINIEPVPVKVFYAEANERITHFRPGRDFTRISLLNTWLVVLTLLWYKPVRLIKGLTLKNIKNLLQVHLFNSGESAARKSMGVAFGVFMGIVPIWGYQLLSALLLAHLLRLNKAIVGVAANISIPPMIPFLLYGSLKTGQWILGHDLGNSIFSGEITLEIVKHHLYEYIAGSFVFAFIMAVLFGSVTYITLTLSGKKTINDIDNNQ